MLDSFNPWSAVAKVLCHLVCLLRARQQSLASVSKADSVMRRRKHSIDMGSREALRRGLINMFNVDFAIEYPRPLVPNVKLIGPVMPREPQGLPLELQVR